MVLTCLAVGSKKLEHACRMMDAGVPSFFGFGVGGRSCPNFLASTVAARLPMVPSLVLMVPRLVLGVTVRAGAGLKKCQHGSEVYLRYLIL